MTQINSIATLNKQTNYGLKTYIPILYALIIASILSALYVLFEYFSHDMISFSNVMGVFMGFYFITYGLPKVFNLKSFAKTCSKYDLIASRFMAYGYIYPLIELGLGFSFLMIKSNTPDVFVAAINIIVIFVSIINIIGISRALKNNSKTMCGCLGASFDIPLSRFSVMENCLMLVMGIIMILNYKTMTGM